MAELHPSTEPGDIFGPSAEAFLRGPPGGTARVRAMAEDSERGLMLGSEDKAKAEARCGRDVWLVVFSE